MHARSTMTAIAFGLAALAAVPAMAQDRDAHFDGPYIGGFVGTAANGNYNGRGLVFDNDGDGRYDDTVTTAAGANAFSPGFCNGRANSARAADGCRGDKDGLEYGGRIGYDRRMNNFVLGGLIEGSKNESIDRATGFSTTPASYTVERKLDYSVAARLRAGYTPGGGALFYVTGGASLAKINHRFLTTNGLNSFDENRDGKTRFGWQAGGGGEIMVTNNVSLGVEYLYNRYKDNKYNVSVGRGTAPANNPFLIGGAGGTNIKVADKDFDYHSLRATVGFHF
ncbi:outer membrane protein [Novosphingobium sp. 9U]|uniref:outer membrane protein n=1 Tax=Novosphingobium sp. 9U TaxID=2653158 RepID=UPI0012F3EC98|nr:outer membrane beta-barrel protein [Novosphingobium sp. 9U]VWX46869.1 Membrane protein [Novosphingobium sp. 9U]